MVLERRAVAAIVKYGDKVLLGKKKIKEGKYLSGKWHILGETLEKDERDEEALKRGVMEEVGIEIKVLRFLGSHKTPTLTTVNWYECEALTYNILPRSDLDDAKWATKKQVIKECGDRSISLWPKDVRDYFFC